MYKVAANEPVKFFLQALQFKDTFYDTIGKKRVLVFNVCFLVEPGKEKSVLL